MSEEILLVAEIIDGIPRHESIPVLQLSSNRYRVLASPGIANGFATGDVLEVTDGSGNFRVVERGGNICVQIFYFGEKSTAVREFGTRFKALGGWLDGGLDGDEAHLLICTIPYQAGFPAIKNVFENLPPAIALDTWMYGNVYKEDGTPINWWLKGRDGN